MKAFPIQELAQARESGIIESRNIHERAMDVATRYKRAEAELIEILDMIDRNRTYLDHQVSSLFSYCTEVLKLSESVAYNLITVMRKSREVPELRELSLKGTITLSNARRVAAVLTRQNQSEWLARAEKLSSRQLEKQIARVLPQTATPERTAYVSASRVRLELGLSEEQMLKLRRAQDQVSQSRQRSVSLEETLAELTGFYLRKKCPVERARRVMVKQGAKVEQGSELEHASHGRRSEKVGRLETQGLAESELSDPSLARASEAKRSAQVSGDFPPSQTNRSQPRGVPSKSSHYFIEARATAKQDRERIPASVLHAVRLRDGRQCVQELKPGVLCGASRFTEIHHVIPVAQGGPNTPENLVTLCFIHHRAWHRSRV